MNALSTVSSRFVMRAAPNGLDPKQMTHLPFHISSQASWRASSAENGVLW